MVYVGTGSPAIISKLFSYVRRTTKRPRHYIHIIRLQAKRSSLIFFFNLHCALNVLFLLKGKENNNVVLFLSFKSLKQVGL